MAIHKAQTYNPQVKFPPQCACCMGSAQTSRELSASSTSNTSPDTQVTWTGKWQVPYCNVCAKHADSTGGPMAIGCITGLLASAGYVLLNDYSKFEWGDWGIAVGILIGATVVLKFALAPVMVVKPGPRCAGQDDIVVCEMKGKGLFMWQFKNSEYGRQFEKMNPS